MSTRLLSILRCAVLALLAGALVAPAWAQPDPRATREREMLRRVQQQLQQTQQQLQTAQQELQTAQAAKAALDAELQQWRARARANATRAERTQRELEAQTAQRETLAGEHDRLRREAREAAEQQAQQLRAAAERQAQLERELAQAREQGRTLDAQLVAQREARGACEQRNEALYQGGRDLIEQRRDRSATATLLRLEPFTGLRRVAIENMLEAQRDRLDEQRTPPAQRP